MYPVPGIVLEFKQKSKPLYYNKIKHHPKSSEKEPITHIRLIYYLKTLTFVEKYSTLIVSTKYLLVVLLLRITDWTPISLP